MSMYRCDGCSKPIDTDEDPDCFDSEGQGFCEPCRDKHFEEGRALAAEYDRERDQAGADWRGENWLGPALKRDRLKDCIDRADMERKRLREEGK